MKNAFGAAAILFLALAFSADGAPADEVQIISMSPASPAVLARGETIEIRFKYNLESQNVGRIVFSLFCEKENYDRGQPLGARTEFEIKKKGYGEGTTRISPQCESPHACLLKTIGYGLGAFQGQATISYTLRCSYDTKPNITSAQPFLVIWGTDPSRKHQVPWNTTVALTAAESIPIGRAPSGRCGFNVEYYEKETKGAPTVEFRNEILSDMSPRTVDRSRLQANETKTVTAQPYLDLGAHRLNLSLDAEHNVDETDEHDNTFSIQYTLSGQCGATPPTPTPRPSSPVH